MYFTHSLSFLPLMFSLRVALQYSLESTGTKELKGIVQNISIGISVKNTLLVLTSNENGNL